MKIWPTYALCQYIEKFSIFELLSFQVKISSSERIFLLPKTQILENKWANNAQLQTSYSKFRGPILKSAGNKIYLIKLCRQIVISPRLFRYDDWKWSIKNHAIFKISGELVPFWKVFIKFRSNRVRPGCIPKLKFATN